MPIFYSPPPVVSAELGGAPNAITGVPDRFYRIVAGTLRNTGGPNYWQPVNDANNRAQNIGTVVTDTTKATITHGLEAIRAASFVVAPDDVLLSAGIRVASNVGLTSTELTFVQGANLSDIITWDGSSWVRSKGASSPFTVSGMADAPSVDYAATITGTSGLAAYYRFEETSGTQVADSSGNARHGTYNTATLNQAGGLPTDSASNSAVFTGTSPSEATFNLTGVLDPVAGCSIEMVYRPLAAGLIPLRDNTSAGGTGYFPIASDGASPAKIQYRVAGTTYTTTKNMADLDDGQFHHVVMTKAGANVALYIDGVLVHSAATATNGAISNSWHLGRNGSSATYQNIAADELAFYTRALTAQEVHDHYWAAFSTGILTVSHADIGTADPAAIAVTSRGGTYRAVVAASGSGVTATAASLEFYDAAGAKLLTAETGMAFALVRPSANRLLNPQAITTTAYPNADITLYGLFEVEPPTTSAPGGEPATEPPATPLPPGGISGDVARVAELGPYRAQFFNNSFWARQLPSDPGARAALVYTHPTIAGADSVNWITNLCSQMGFDYAASQGQPAPVYAAGPVVTGKAVLKREAEPLHIVPADQPLVTVVDQDTSSPTATGRFNTLVTALGGLPIPADAMPGNSADRFLGVYQPANNLYIQLYAAGTTDPATVTLSLTSSPTSGTFALTFNYGDHVTFPNTYTTINPIAWNATAAQVKAAIDTARSATGTVFPVGQSIINCLASGGPLDVAPVVLTFTFAMALKPVFTQVTNSTLDQGTVAVQHHNQGRVNRCRLGSIVTPGGGAGGAHVHYGRSQDRDVAGFWWEDVRWGGTATRILQICAQPSYDEVQDAIAAGTGVPHAIPMLLAHPQATPIPYVTPAGAGDGDRASSPTVIPEGTRIAFSPDVDLSFIQANYPEIMWLARTIRDHGCITYDKTAIGCSLMFRRASWSGTSFNPWLDLLPLYATNPSASHAYMKALPWHKAQIIDPAFSAP